MRVVFEQQPEDRPFTSCHAAEAWCRDRGISVGIMQGPDPRGLLYGDFDIQKWRNLNRREREQLHGRMTGNMRDGPVVVEIAERSECWILHSPDMDELRGKSTA